MSRLLDNGTTFSAQQSYSGPKNSSYIIPGVYDLTVEDTNWVLTSSFIIFTMVSILILVWGFQFELTFYVIYVNLFHLSYGQT